MSEVKKILLFWIMIIMVVGCKFNPNENNYIITGQISGAGGQYIFLEELTVKDLFIIDSVMLDRKGNFQFDHHPDDVGIYLLRLNGGEFATVVLVPMEPLKLTAQTHSFPNQYSISGNEDSEILETYFTETAKKQEVLDSISKIFRNSTHREDYFQIKARVDSAFQLLFYEQQHFTRNLIEANPFSLASVLLINQKFGNKKLFEAEKDLNLFLLTDSCLSRAYPGNSHVMAHHQRVTKTIEKIRQQEAAEERLAPGKPVPELKLPDAAGDLVVLGSLKGKTVLINFWSSYSPPCRAKNIQVNEIYKNFRHKGLVVYAVSFDQNEKIWKDVISMEKLDWINVIVPQSKASTIKRLFYLPDELPFYFLVDGNGKIQLRSGDQAEILRTLRRLVSE